MSEASAHHQPESHPPAMSPRGAHALVQFAEGMSAEERRFWGQRIETLRPKAAELRQRQSEGLLPRMTWLRWQTSRLPGMIWTVSGAADAIKGWIATQAPLPITAKYVSVDLFQDIVKRGPFETTGAPLGKAIVIGYDQRQKPADCNHTIAIKANMLYLPQYLNEIICMPRANRDLPPEFFWRDIVDADTLPDPPQELLMEIVDMFLPDPAILPLLERAWGVDSDIYRAMHSTLTGQPGPEYGPVLAWDIDHFVDWLNDHGGHFQNLPPIRPEYDLYPDSPETLLP